MVSSVVVIAIIENVPNKYLVVVLVVVDLRSFVEMCTKAHRWYAHI